jgi:hypothetical protein
LRPSFPSAPKPFDLTVVANDGRNLESSAGDFPPPWRGTRCLWELTDGAGGGTTIRFSHRDWDEANPMVGRVTLEWGRILDHLARYVETGTPDPRTPAGAYEDQRRPIQLISRHLGGYVTRRRSSVYRPRTFYRGANGERHG